MSIRVQAEGKDLNIAHKPYRISCDVCDCEFTFIEKDADVGQDDAGFKRLAVHCPGCQKLCVTGHHENVATAEKLAAEQVESMGSRGKVNRPSAEG